MAWTIDQIVIPPHGIEIAKNGRPMYAKAMGRKSLASVTGVIGGNNGWSQEQLCWWANKIGRLHGVTHKEFVDEAARIGTMGHGMVEAHLKGRPIPTFPNDDQEMVEQARNSHENFLSWFRNMDFHLIVAEYPLVCRWLEVGGTIDIMALVNGEIILCDLKTSNGVYESHKAQVACYREMWNRKFPQYPIDKVWILQIGKTEGGFAHYQLSDVDVEGGLFDFCSWRVLEERKKDKTLAALKRAKALMDRFNQHFNGFDF